jgi:hypothetical protein
VDLYLHSSAAFTACTGVFGKTLKGTFIKSVKIVLLRSSLEELGEGKRQI